MAKVWKQVKLNLSEKDYKVLKNNAEKANKPMSVYVKDSINIVDDLSVKKIKTKPIKPVDSKLLYELNRIGNNLNQISKNLNFGKQIDKTILNELVEIRLNIELLIEKVK